MTIPDNDHFFGLARVYEHLIRWVRPRTIKPGKAEAKRHSHKTKRRSHRTTAFFEMP